MMHHTGRHQHPGPRMHQQQQQPLFAPRTGGRPNTYATEDHVDSLEIGHIAPVSSNYHSDTEDLYGQDAVIPESELLDHMESASARDGGATHPGPPAPLLSRAVKRRPVQVQLQVESPAPPPAAGRQHGSSSSSRPVSEAELIRDLEEEESHFQKQRNSNALRSLNLNANMGAAGAGAAKQKRRIPNPAGGAENASPQDDAVSSGGEGAPLIATSAATKSPEAPFVIQKGTQPGRLGGDASAGSLAQAAESGDSGVIPGTLIRRVTDGAFETLSQCDEQAQSIIQEVERFTSMHASKVPIKAVHQLIGCYRHLRGEHQSTQFSLAAGDKQREILVVELERMREEAMVSAERQGSREVTVHHVEAVQKHQDERDRLSHRLEQYEKQQQEQQVSDGEVHNILQVCEDVLRNSKEQMILLEGHRVQLLASLAKKDDEMQQLHEMVKESRKSMQAAQSAGIDMVRDKQQELQQVMAQLEDSNARCAELTAQGACAQEQLAEVKRQLRVLEDAVSDRDATVEAMRYEMTATAAESQDQARRVYEVHEEGFQKAEHGKKRFVALAAASATSLGKGSDVFVFARHFAKWRVFAAASVLRKVLDDKKNRFEADLQAAWREQDSAVADATRLATELNTAKSDLTSERDKHVRDRDQSVGQLQARLAEAEGKLKTIRNDMHREFSTEVDLLKGVAARNERALREGEDWYDNESRRSAAELRDLRVRLRGTTVERDELRFDVFYLRETLNSTLIAKQEHAERTVLEQGAGKCNEEIHWDHQLRVLEEDMEEQLKLKLDAADYSLKRKESILRKEREEGAYLVARKKKELDKEASAMRLEQHVAMEKLKASQSLADAEKRDLISATTSRLKEIVMKLEMDRKQQVDRLTEQLQALRQERSDLQAEVQRIPDIESALQSTEDELREQRTIAQQLPSLQCLYDQLSADMDVLQQSYNETKHIADQLPEALRTAETAEHLLSEVRALQADTADRLQQETRQRQLLEEEAASLTRALEDLREDSASRVRVAEAERDSCRAELEEAAAAAAALGEKLSATKSALAAKEAECDASTAEASRLGSALDTLREVHTRLSEQHDSDRRAARETVSRLEQQLCGVQADLLGARGELERAAAAARQAEDDFAVQELALQRLRDDHDDLRGSHETLVVAYNHAVSMAEARQVTARGVDEISRVHTASTHLCRRAYATWRLHAALGRRMRYMRGCVAPQLLRETQRAALLGFFARWLAAVGSQHRRTAEGLQVRVGDAERRCHDVRVAAAGAAVRLLEAKTRQGVAGRFFSRIAAHRSSRQCAAERGKLEAHAAEVEGQRARAEGQLSIEVESVARLEARIEQADAQAASLQQQLGVLHGTLAQAEAEGGSLRTQLAGATAASDTLRTELREKGLDLEALRSEAAGTREQLAVKAAEAGTLRTALDGAEAEGGSLRTQLAEATATSDTLRAELQEKRLALATLHEQLAAKTGEADALRSTLGGAESEGGSLRTQLADATAASEALRVKLQEATQTASELRAEAKTANTTCDTVRADLKQSEAKLSSLRAELQEGSDAIDDLHSRLEEAQAENRSLRVHLDDSGERAVALHAQVEDQRLLAEAERRRAQAVQQQQQPHSPRRDFGTNPDAPAAQAVEARAAGGGEAGIPVATQVSRPQLHATSVQTQQAQERQLPFEFHTQQAPPPPPSADPFTQAPPRPRRPSLHTMEHSVHIPWSRVESEPSIVAHVSLEDIAGVAADVPPPPSPVVAAGGVPPGGDPHHTQLVAVLKGNIEKWRVQYTDLSEAHEAAKRSLAQEQKAVHRLEVELALLQDEHEVLSKRAAAAAAASQPRGADPEEAALHRQLLKSKRAAEAELLQQEERHRDTVERLQRELEAERSRPSSPMQPMPPPAVHPVQQSVQQQGVLLGVPGVFPAGMPGQHQHQHHQQQNAMAEASLMMTVAERLIRSDQRQHQQQQQAPAQPVTPPPVEQGVVQQQHRRPMPRSRLAFAPTCAALNGAALLRRFYVVLRINAVHRRHLRETQASLHVLNSIAGLHTCLYDAALAVQREVSALQEAAKGRPDEVSPGCVEAAVQEALAQQQASLRSLEEEICRQRLEIGWKNNRIKMMQRAAEGVGSVGSSGGGGGGSIAGSTPPLKPALKSPGKPSRHRAEEGRPRAVSIVTTSRSLSPPRPLRRGIRPTAPR